MKDEENPIVVMSAEEIAVMIQRSMDFMATELANPTPNQEEFREIYFFLSQLRNLHWEQSKQQ
jgi:hypothetical protein